MDGDSFQKLLLAEIDAVHRLASHLSRSRVEVDDVVQETFLRALKSAATFTLAADYGIRAWLFKILHNVIHTRYAKDQRERGALETLQYRSPAEASSSGAATAATGCATTVDWDGIDQRLKHAIADLPLVFREAFLLSAVEGLKYRQIAEVIDAPIGTVMSRLARARSMLSERLSDLALEQRLGREIESTEMSKPSEASEIG